MNVKIYEKPSGVQTRWISFENPTGAKGQAAQKNAGVKGNAYGNLHPFETVTLCDFDGCGVINRIWMTLGALDPSLPEGSPAIAVTPSVLRALRIDMYWDNAETPAVSAPLGDFFGSALSIRKPMDNALFADPEGRSFNCYAKMPFRKHARITVTNESGYPQTLTMYYKISLSVLESLDENAMYFHAYWNREKQAELTTDYTILPKVSGSGRYLGANLGVLLNPGYLYTWWGEGEVKLFMDGDTENPTLAGTGAEDYPGSGYGLGLFAHRYQGSIISNGDMAAFYRYHIEDPVFFDTDCRVMLQRLGSAQKHEVLQMCENGTPLIVTAAQKTADNTIYRFLDEHKHLNWRDDFLEGGDYLHLLRNDDWSSTAYFYLDAPENGLRALPAVDIRMADMPTKRG